LLQLPGGPAMSAETAEQVRELVTKGGRRADRPPLVTTPRARIVASR
jgi:hypothetical protein